MKIANSLSGDDRNLIPIRIREARLARGYSLNDLADELGISKQVISKYELGTVKIPIENLIKISELFNFPISFFYKLKDLTINNSSESVTFFRSLRSTSKRTEISLEQNIEFIQEIYSLLQGYIDFPELDLPEDIASDYKIGVDDEYIEEIANRLRNYWNLGDRPIKNLSNLLLRKGFIISRVELKTQKVDAFSKLTSSGIPCIILGSDKDSAVRSRIDLSHELAHIIMHSHIEKSEFERNIRIIESEAKRFAGAFLLPAESFANDIYSINLDSFIHLKEKWKVSIAAMIVRAHSLGIINNEQYSSLYKQINLRKWRTTEPLDDIIDPEKPSMIKEAIELLSENDILTIEEFLEEVCLSYDDIENLCFLPNGYFNNILEKDNKPKFKIIK
ncbi:hypothetical protein OXPF_05840 [Oxobacter pfennigii]|uniref:HTH cro/C1-type domain-containing protein n=1 Tax=Oxobacter pfennigii TaxID=36849 RepID=A0A0P8WT40_9CLOT|nr:XRE family transcriptional regulator [Oxobacter pfennigii]KPU45795.1 hypothetical protein OXPF_05840 [Oxobacter pfennigii]